MSTENTTHEKGHLPSMYDLCRGSIYTSQSARSGRASLCCDGSSMRFSVSQEDSGHLAAAPADVDLSSARGYNRHNVSLGGAARQYGKRLSVAEVPIALCPVSERRASLRRGRDAATRSCITSLVLETIIRRTSTAAAGNDDAKPPLGGSAGRAPLTRPSSSRFAAIFKHTVDGLSAMNENRVGFSPVASAALGAAESPRADAHGGVDSTSGTVFSPSAAGPTIRIRAKPTGELSPPQKPSLTPATFTPSTSTMRSGTGTLDGTGFTVPAVFANGAAKPRVGRHLSTAAGFTFPTEVSDAPQPQPQAWGGEGPGAAAAEPTEEEMSSLSSLSWSRVRQQLAMQSIEAEENRMYVPEPTREPCADGGSAAVPARHSIMDKRHVLVKKPVLLGDSFVDDDTDSVSTGDDD